MSNLENVSPTNHVSVKTYVIGFILALALTVAAFAATEWQIASGQVLIALLLGLALIQTSVQLWFFLHLGREEKPHWNTLFLFNTISVILLIVIASIWVMNSLNQRMMSPTDMEKYAIEEGSKGF